MAYILGLNAYHGDSSACLVQDGKLIAAVEEERFRRIKHWAGFPSNLLNTAFLRPASRFLMLIISPSIRMPKRICGKKLGLL